MIYNKALCIQSAHFWLMQSIAISWNERVHCVAKAIQRLTSSSTEFSCANPSALSIEKKSRSHRLFIKKEGEVGELCARAAS